MKYLYSDAKLKKNIKNVKGGLEFRKAVSRSLTVRKFAEARILKCRYNSEPVSFNDVMYPPGLKGANEQASVNKLFNRKDLKPKKEGAMPCRSQVCTEPEVPVMFFSLPFFEWQESPVVKVTPTGAEDKMEFMFVAFDSFLPKNSSSVAYNAI